MANTSNNFSGLIQACIADTVNNGVVISVGFLVGPEIDQPALWSEFLEAYSDPLMYTSGMKEYGANYRVICKKALQEGLLTNSKDAVSDTCLYTKSEPDIYHAINDAQLAFWAWVVKNKGYAWTTAQLPQRVVANPRYEQ